MGRQPPNGVTKKRKQDAMEHEEEEEDLPAVAGLDITSDEGEAMSGSDDDGEMDDFPELDLGSSEESTSEASDESEEPSEKESEGQPPSTLEKPTPAPGDLVVSSITGRLKRIFPEIEPDYDSDSSTEDAPNRVGNVPAHWYDDLPHVGYDINGQKVLRPAKGDELDKFLDTVENPESWTSAFDRNLQSDKALSAEELDIIRRLYAGENPDAGYDPYEPTVEWFTGKGKEEVMPLSAAPEPKRRFVPSKWEKQKIMKIVRAIRQGRIVPNKPKTADNKANFYAIWDAPASDHPAPAPAPKPRLPTNAESYNPPEEYLPTSEERKEWEEADKEDRERDFLPQKYSSLRLVPAYPEFINNRFDRLLDLYMAPRIQRRKLDIDPDSLIPTLPSPQSLRPFPTYRALHQKHHGSSRARCVSVSPDDEWVVSGDESGLVCLWELMTGHVAARWRFGQRIGSVVWCPRLDVSLFAVGLDEEIVLVSPPFVKGAIGSATKSLFEGGGSASVSGSTASKGAANGNAGASVSWTTRRSVPGTTTTSSSTLEAGDNKETEREEDGPVEDEDGTVLQCVRLPRGSGRVTQLAFHRKGDYFSSLCGGGATSSSSSSSSSSLWIHQVSKRSSQAPFKKVKGSVQRTVFHPNKPMFFVATQRYVRMYDLAAQELVKTLQPGIKWISSVDVHPSGDHVVVGGYDRKLCWFDLELSDKPYKVLRYHARAIRSVTFHATYPLMASCSDDGTVQVFHCRAYNDLMTDALIVPLKVLRGGHDVVDGLGVLDACWTRTRPWLVSAGADGRLSVWCP